MLNPLSTIITWWLKRRIPQIEHVSLHPIETQMQQWKEIFEKGRLTEWGRQHHFSRFHTLKEFQEAVPTRSYEELFPWIERAMKGEENLLWPGITNSFSKSSGTTNDRSKFIPVTDDSLEDCHYKGGKDLIALYLANREGTEVLGGKNLAMGGSLHKNDLNPGIICGDISAVIMNNLPAWAQWMRTPSLEVALLDRWEEKIEKIIESTREENITSISGVPTWMLVLFNRLLEVHQKRDISEIWPNLEVFLHGAVSFTPYRDVFKKLVSNPGMSYMETYNASEGFFGIQDDLAKEGEMLLMLDYGIYYEFVSPEDAHEPFPKVYHLDEVEIGKNYAVVITTNGGLWRYRLGDTIRFTSLQPFRIQVSGRTRHFINAFGEEVMVENADFAISRASQICGLTVVEYTVAPAYMDAGRQGFHEWLIEFSDVPAEIESFSLELDRQLRMVNADYDAKRYMDMALLPPKIHVARPNTFYQWLKQKGKLGGQHKVPRLSNSREYLDPLLELMSGL